MPIVAITMLFAALFFLSTEKTMLKEGHLELTHEVRNDIMIKSLGKSASAMFAFMLIVVYLIINFFPFTIYTPAYSSALNSSTLVFSSAMINCPFRL